MEIVKNALLNNGSKEWGNDENELLDEMVDKAFRQAKKEDLNFLQELVKFTMD